MATYVILSHVTPEALCEPEDFKTIAENVSRKIKDECPGVKWRESYVTTGRFDIVDIVESDDIAQVERAGMIIRGVGRTLTETMLATPWKDFIGSLEKREETERVRPAARLRAR